MSIKETIDILSLQPAPFSFDQRDHEMMVKKEEKIRKVDFVKIRMWSKFKVLRKSIFRLTT